MAAKKTPFCKTCDTEMTETDDPIFRLHCPTCNLGCHKLAEKQFINFRKKE